MNLQTRWMLPVLLLPVVMLGCSVNEPDEVTSADEAVEPSLDGTDLVVMGFGSISPARTTLFVVRSGVGSHHYWVGLITPLFSGFRYWGGTEKPSCTGT